MVNDATDMQTGRQNDEAEGDGEAMAGFEVRRFTREEVERGDAEGWLLRAGWFRRASGLEWAWFERRATEEIQQCK